MWEKISPPARRKRQIANMEDGFRQVLGLVQSMRENQEVLMESYRKLPEAVESVKKLADHSAQQSELLQAMNQHMGADGSTGKFTETLASMDKTTQLLLERAQRSEERLYGMLRRAQRRIALMTLLVLLLFVGAVTGVLLIAFPDQTRSWFSREEAPVATETPTPVPAASPTPGTAPSPAPVELESVIAPPPEDSNLPVPLPEKAEVLAEAPEVPAGEEPVPVPVPTATPAPLPTATPAPAPTATPTATPEADPESVDQAPAMDGDPEPVAVEEEETESVLP
jgi:hypothetical protein